MVWEHNGNGNAKGMGTQGEWERNGNGNIMGMGAQWDWEHNEWKRGHNENGNVVGIVGL